MKTKITTITVMFLVFLCSSAQADLIWDSGHHIFGEGTENHVAMFNDASADIIGGTIHEFYMYNSTSADISGGYVGILLGQDTSSVDVYNNSDIHLLRPNDSSTANVYGGEIRVVFALGESNTFIYEGVIDEIDAIQSSIVTFYCEDDYVLDPTGGEYGDGLVTGTWFYSGESFSIDLRSDETKSHLRFIPEPCSLIIMTFGACIISNKRKYKR